MKTYYELLQVERTASADEIKRAFRRQIAKYHPDKVQHLGNEFQEIAVTRAAELTLAYKMLTDQQLRAEYDAQLDATADAPQRTVRTSPPSPVDEAAALRPDNADHRPAQPPPTPPPDVSPFAQDRAGAMDLVFRATVIRFRHAMKGEFGDCEEPASGGFDIICTPPKSSFFSKLQPRFLARFVPRVDGETVAETWVMASKAKRDPQRDICVFLLGPVVAPAGELASAIAGQRRNPVPGGGNLVLIPVNTRSWLAHVPTDAPPVVKSVLNRLKNA